MNRIVIPVLFILLLIPIISEVSAQIELPEVGLLNSITLVPCLQKTKLTKPAPCKPTTQSAL